MFRQKVMFKFTLKIQREKTTSNENKNNDKITSFIKLSLPILAKPFKEILEKSKFFKKRQISKKIDNIHKIIHDTSKPKSKLNMTTKDSLRKQIIVLISNDNKAKFIVFLSEHITNFNRVFKNIKSEVIVDFAHIDQNNIVIVTNEVVFLLDLQTIEKYVKNIKHFNSKDINTSCLFQSKFYLKIKGISYFLENTNISITLDFVETIIKNNYIWLGI